MNATQEYTKIYLTRQKGEWIEIGVSNGKITSFYETYPGMSNYIRGYEGIDAQATVKQLEECGWRVD